MDTAIVVALISFSGTLLGTAGGIIASGKLTAYRLQQLEEKLDRQGTNVSKIPVIEERISNINRRVARIESNGIHTSGYTPN